MKQPFANKNVLFRFTPSEEELADSGEFRDYSALAYVVTRDRRGVIDIYAQFQDGWELFNDYSWGNVIARLLTERDALTAEVAERRSCPCNFTTPCHLQCTCVMPHSSRGCRRCCRYGSLEQQQAKATYLVAREGEYAALTAERDIYRTALNRVVYFTDGIMHEVHRLARAALEQGAKIREGNNG